jgi:hypothetical protein
MRIFLLLLTCLITSSSFAGVLKGYISNPSGEEMPMVSIYVKNTTYGTTSNLKGNYFLELEEGNHTIVFSFSGFAKQEKEVVITKGTIVLDIVLQEALLETVNVVANKKDRAKEIIKAARDKRRFYNKQVENFTCSVFLKTSIDKKTPIDTHLDSAIISEVPAAANMNDFYQKINLNLIESISELTHERSNKYKEHFLGYKDYSESSKSMDVSTSIGISYGEEDFAPIQREAVNPFILYNDVQSTDLNFYDNLISFPAVSQQPIPSPIGDNGTPYRFDLDGSFYENGKLIYKISVEPFFKTDPTFSGIVFIEDSTWKLVSVDLKVNPASMHFCEEFSIIQNYTEVEENVMVPTRLELNYTIKDGKDYIIGNTKVNRSKYLVNTPDFETKWTSEVKTFDVYALDRDSTYWKENRAFELTEKESSFIHVCDSLTEYFDSPEFYAKQDSVFNDFSWKSIFAGVGRRNTYRGMEWRVGGILEQINPLGIGGYRHKLPGYINKEWDNGFKLENEGFVDYGFNNKDFKGKLSMGFTYVPKKFVRTKILIADYYDQINNFASLTQVFSGSNYIRKKEYGLSHRMEIFNGFYGEIGFNYSDQIPIDNLELSKWRAETFGDLNTPVDFDRYVKSEITVDLKYRIKQKYMYKDNRKLIIEAKHPELNLKYRKGVPGLFNSEVNYDYIEVSANHEIQLKRLGSSYWKATAGTYLNKGNLRVLEHKYFRGSDPFFFMDPVKSFQLLGPTLSTPNNFLQANYMHHFEGSIMNKIPLINRLKLQLAGGGGILLIEDDSFRHVEVFAGIERVFKIRKELVRFGGYFVTSDNTLGSADYTFKLGFSFFSAFSGKFDY